MSFRVKLQRRHLVMGGVAGLAVAAGALLMRPEVVDVDAGTVGRDTLRVTVDAEGRTRVRDRYVVTAPVTGRLLRVALVEGAAVRAGDVVADIAPPPLDAATQRQAAARLAAARALRDQAAARLAQARASTEDARRGVGRAVRLASAGALAPRDREQAELALATGEDAVRGATAQLAAARADVAAAEAALLPLTGARDSWTAVRSPVAGRVLRVPDRSERVLPAGAPILELGNASALEVVVDILSADAVRVRPGAPVALHDWGGGAPLRGHVRWVEPSAFTRVSALGVEEQRVNVVIDVDDPPPTLGDGFRVEVRILVDERPDALVVPASALVRAQDGWRVFTVEDGRARHRRVEIGAQGEAAVEVRQGLAPGERVLLFPSDVIADGVRVRAR